MTRYIEARIDGGLFQEVAACGPTAADNGYGPQQEANARLIASAPRLLDALAAVVKAWDHIYPDLKWKSQEHLEDIEFREMLEARAAITAAGGDL